MQSLDLGSKIDRIGGGFFPDLIENGLTEQYSQINLFFFVNLGHDEGLIMLKYGDWTFFEQGNLLSSRKVI